jgi:uncharacterized protein (TIGR02284 family)
METKELEKELNSLIHLDHDAVSAYESAIGRIDNEPIKQQLRSFQEDHKRHIRDLSNALKSAGGKPNDRSDVKGVFIKGFTAVTSMMGTEAALRAMQGNEKLTTSTYARAREKDFGPSIKTIIDRNYEDERRHLAYIENTLRTRPWESASAHP